MNDASSSGAGTRRGWWTHLSLITLWLLAEGVVARFRSHTQANAPALTATAGGLLVVCTFELLVFGAVFGLAIWESRASRDDLLLRWRQGFWPVPLGIGYSVVIRFLVGFVAVVVGSALVLTRVMSTQSLHHFVLHHRPDVAAAVDISALRHNPLYFWLNLTLVSFVLGGVREELWRSAFIAGLGRLWPRRFGSTNGAILAVVVAAVVFGAAHVYMGLLAAVGAGVIGLALGLVMVFHRSIWPAVIAHGAFDATTFALLPWISTKLPEIQRTLGH